MTREEKSIALYCLKASSDYHSEVCEECIKYPNCDHTIQDDVTETIIKALEQTPSSDAVDREELKKWLDMNFSFGGALRKIELFDRLDKELPSVAPTRKVGKWENGNPICPCCGEDKFKDLVADIWADWQPKYCPNCGAKMESEQLKKYDCTNCKHDGFICDECKNGSKYEMENEQND